MASDHPQRRLHTSGSRQDDLSKDREQKGPSGSTLPRDEATRPSTGDREELMRRIKRGERPQWTPSEQLLRLLAENENEDRHLASHFGLTDSKADQANGDAEIRPASPLITRPKAAFLEDSAQIGLEIPRPRSALHSGDFNTHSPSSHNVLPSSHFARSAAVATSPPRPIPQAPSPVTFTPKHGQRSAFSRPTPPSIRTAIRERAPSLTSSSPRYVLKPPTSPLVRETNNDDTDLERFIELDSPSRARRHTLTPVGSLTSSNNYFSYTQAARQPPSLRKEATFPLQDTSKRRSLNASWSYQPASSRHAPPLPRPRAPSFSSDSSPRQKSMVGSYEESILRGRMSGTPSQAINFTAELGAVGKKGHKPSCPAHVHVQFPAVYYSWAPGTGRVGSSEQEPSPYVGRIDLEHNLAPPKLKEDRRRGQEIDTAEILAESPWVTDDGKRRKRKRRDSPPMEGLIGGCYRIPQQGSLQIMIRNPNKSAAKVFIVPYDLEGMPSGTRTWVRQRCYSAGPIIERAVSSGLGSPSALNGKPLLADSKSRPTLRYLVHLKICCPSRGRFYLYDEIRVVFANRVPDNKENLKYEVQMQDPKFTVFKPQARRSTMSSTVLSDVLARDEDAVLRPRSYGLDYADSPLRSLPASSVEGESSWFLSTTPSTPVPALPASFEARPRSYTVGTLSGTESTDVGTMSSDSACLQSSDSTDLWERKIGAQLTSPSRERALYHAGKRSNNLLTTQPDSSREGDESRFTKLKQGDNRYGGAYGRPGTPEPGEGLIARRLRDLGVDERDDLGRSTTPQGSQ